MAYYWDFGIVQNVKTLWLKPFGRSRLGILSYLLLLPQSQHLLFLLLSIRILACTFAYRSEVWSDDTHLCEKDVLCCSVVSGEEGVCLVLRGVACGVRCLGLYPLPRPFPILRLI